MRTANHESQVARQESRPLDVRGVLKTAMGRLREARVPSHTLAAELLLMHVLGRDRAWLYAHPEEMLEPASAQQYFELLTRRAAGTPTQYLTGRQEFWGLEFEVTPDVLIPRPETEHLIEVVLERLGPAQCGEKHGAENPPALRIADVGTGSGCLAVALARELPAAELMATDVSAGALAVARRNAAQHGVAERIEFVQCNLLAGFAASWLGMCHSKLDVIVSNPPYVGREEAGALPREVREHEPAAALYGGAQGAEIYAPLVEQAAEHLRPRGILVLELGYNVLARVRPLLEGAGYWVKLSVTKDLAGIPRILAAERL